MENADQPLAPGQAHDEPNGQAAGASLVTRHGLRLLVRPVSPADEPALAEFFRHVTPDDLRFRFLTAVNEVSHARLHAMVDVAPGTESFLAMPADDPQKVIGVAMLAAAPDNKRAEVAISIHAEYKGRGIGWTLLDYLANHARDRGIGILESIESRENHEAITLEREMGFTVHGVEGDPGLVILRRTLV